MAVMGKKVWAVVCGAMRQEFELYITLAMLCEYRSRGLLEGIVLSTWKGEVNKISGLRKKIEKLNVLLVESASISDEVGKYINKGYARQSHQLNAALDSIPDDVFVLKCRTDYSENIINNVENILLGNVDLRLGIHGDFNAGLNYRIAVERFPVDAMFTMEDIGYLGYKADLKKMISYEFMNIRYGFIMWSDRWFFEAIFTHQFPILDEYLVISQNQNIVNGGMIKRYISSGDVNSQNFALPGIFNKIYALYFLLLDTCFYLIMQEKHKDTDFSLSDVFNCRQEIGMKQLWGTCFSDPTTLRKVVAGDCEPTEGYIKLYKEICNLARKDYAIQMHITKQDYEETCQWIRKVYVSDPANYIKWKQKMPVNTNPIDFSKTVALLFSDYPIAREEELSEIFYDICFEKSKNYYSTEKYYAGINVYFYQRLISKLDTIKSLNNEIYELALGPAERSFDAAILKKCAKALYYCEVKSKNEESYSYFFERWGADPVRFYSLPILPDQIYALYYYGKYAERVGKLTVPKTFYNRLVQLFKLPDRPVPESYADGVLELMQEIVNTRYKEYTTNLSIKYLAVFLEEEFGSDAFLPEVYNYLKEMLP